MRVLARASILLLPASKAARDAAVQGRTSDVRAMAGDQLSSTVEAVREELFRLDTSMCLVLLACVHGPGGLRFGVLGVRDEHAEDACSECRHDTLQCVRVGVRSVRSGMLSTLQHAWCMRLHSLPSHARCAGRSWLLRAQERQRTM